MQRDWATLSSGFVNTDTFKILFCIWYLGKVALSLKTSRDGGWFGWHGSSLQLSMFCKSASLQLSMFSGNIYLQYEWECGQQLTKNLGFYYRLQLHKVEICIFTDAEMFLLFCQIRSLCFIYISLHFVLVSYSQIVTS